LTKKRDKRCIIRIGEKWVASLRDEQDIFTVYERDNDDNQPTDKLLSDIKNILLNGTQLILNQAFNLIGFDFIKDDVFRHLVVARLCQPLSKAGIVDCLKDHFDEDVAQHNIYRC
jgi:hypothetical protein